MGNTRHTICCRHRTPLLDTVYVFLSFSPPLSLSTKCLNCIFCLNWFAMNCLMHDQIMLFITIWPSNFWLFIRNSQSKHLKQQHWMKTIHLKFWSEIVTLFFYTTVIRTFYSFCIITLKTNVLIQGMKHYAPQDNHQTSVLLRVMVRREVL